MTPLVLAAMIDFAWSAHVYLLPFALGALRPWVKRATAPPHGG